MNRKHFLQSMAFFPFVYKSLHADALNNLMANPDIGIKMPVLFLGHGSPMNAIEQNEFVTGFKNLAAKLPKPTAILCVSAHWETKGTFVTAMPKPKTIHDFGGFPQALFNVQYPANGNVQLANEVKSLAEPTNIGLNLDWGLDHGAWSVLIHLYPKADVPVIQLSLDYTKPPAYHYELAKKLQSLRNKGVLIVGSGNMVHNLRLVDWRKLNEPNYAFDWAEEASTKLKSLILNNNHNALMQYQSLGNALQLAIPTPEHYLPLLYTLALQNNKDQVTLFNDKAVGGALTMTSVYIHS